LIKIGEFKNSINGYMHNTFNVVVKPSMVAAAYLLGCPPTITGLFLGFELMDWLNWPLSLMPRFYQEI
jgi:hypothetical protein